MKEGEEPACRCCALSTRAFLSKMEEDSAATTVRFNVGGTIFAARKEIFLHSNDDGPSFFSQMFSGDFTPAKADNTGAFIIEEHDAVAFGWILHYIENGTIPARSLKKIIVLRYERTGDQLLTSFVR